MASIGKTIDDYKAAYNAAKAAGDSAGMQAANDGANAFRAAKGQAAEYATADIATTAAKATTSQTATTANSNTSSSFQGSATGVNVNTSNQEAIKAQMNANSQAWHTASAEEKVRLEQANKTLADQLGGSVGFDSSSGTWSGSAAGQQQATTTAVNDYSSYIEQMNKAKQEAARAALQAAYDKNVSGLNRARDAIAPEYQSARNEAAGQAELQKKNFAEYANAHGLNSGAGGQAQLSFQNALQGNLSNISAKEASTLADMELQRSQMETDYNNAIAQAEAQGNYELAQQLYQEKVRQDEAMRQQMQWQAQMDLQSQQFQWQQGQADIANGQWSQQFDTSNQQWNQQWALKMAQEQAAGGNFDGYRALGYSDAAIAQMQATYDQDRKLALAKAYSTATSGSSGSSGTGKTTYNKTQYDLALALAMDGDTSAEVRKIVEGYSGLSFNTVLAGNGYTAPAAKSTSESAMNAVKRELTALEDTRNPTTAIRNAIQRHYNNKTITEEQARQLLQQYGMGG